MLSIKKEKSCLLDYGIVQKVTPKAAQKSQNRAWSGFRPRHPPYTPDRCVNVGTLMQHPLRLVHMKQSITTEDERQ